MFFILLKLLLAIYIFFSLYILIVTVGVALFASISDLFNKIIDS